MALSISQTVALGHILKAGKRVASMGYPDIIAPLHSLERLHDLGGITYRADSAAICKRHGIKDRQIPDAHSFFGLFGCTLDVYDIVQERGCEILCDLNVPLRDHLIYNYDIVLDVGTLEHCFNIAQAMMNMAGMVKEGGYIIHENPFCAGNHGFYGLNPTFYADFYTANGFEILELKLVNKQGAEAPVSHTQRFKYTESEVNVFAMARRVEVKSFVFPVQSKYANVVPAAVDNRAKEQANG